MASNLAGSANKSVLSEWVCGVGVALAFILYGIFCSMTSHAWVPNIHLRGFHGKQTGLLTELFGRPATALGFLLIGLGLFANVHYCWPRFEQLSRNAEFAKVAALVVIITAASWWIYASI